MPIFKLCVAVSNCVFYFCFLDYLFVYCHVDCEDLE